MENLELKNLGIQELGAEEMKNVEGGNTNYIAGLGPAIPSSGGDYVVGFFVGFFPLCLIVFN